MSRIIDACVRHYRDNGQTTAYVKWDDNTRTEGPARKWQPTGTHMQQLFERAKREGVEPRKEEW